MPPCPAGMPLIADGTTCASPRARRELSMSRMRLRHFGDLVGAGFLLVLRLPLVIGHAVDGFAALVLAERNTFCVGSVLQPVRQAVAAEAREIHQVDVLHISARAQ